MSIVSEISRIIIKSNDDYLKSFLQFYKQQKDTDIESVYTKFITKKPSQIYKEQRCVHVFTKGAKNNQKCNILVKTGGMYCSKHKKNHPSTDEMDIDFDMISCDEQEIIVRDDVEEEDDDDVSIEEEWKSETDVEETDD